ncbi:hypothetical protein [Streptomyces sp. NPDC059224]|uniref:hypothetical protein n=1 Tax=Streptomyces sp. NPDC059224 TaxID=3346775 RepID=UPI0036AE6B57
MFSYFRLASLSTSAVLVFNMPTSRPDEGDVTATVTLSAALTAMLLSELAFDTDDTAFWRRWLGWWGYVWRRALLALVPVFVALLVCQAVSTNVGIAQQLAEGLAAGVTASALLRADARTRVRAGHVPEAAQAASVLSWIYRQACRRFDARARRAIEVFVFSLRMAGPGGLKGLLLTAEEVEGALSKDLGGTHSVKERKALQDRLDSLRAQMDLVIDPFANDRARRRAGTVLAESIVDELAQRRWSRPSNNNETKEGR